MMPKSDALVISVWAAVVFGLMEGAVLTITRAYPELLAPFKASAHLLWVAPLVDLPLFLAAALASLLGLGLLRRWAGGKQRLLVYGLFVFLGVFTVLEAPKVIHPLAVAVLSLGLAVAFCSRLRGHEDKLTDFLRRRLVWSPVLIVVAAAGVYAFQRGAELWRLYQLPPL